MKKAKAAGLASSGPATIAPANHMQRHPATTKEPPTTRDTRLAFLTTRIDSHPFPQRARLLAIMERQYFDRVNA
jgi:hypothetical protein